MASQGPSTPTSTKPVDASKPGPPMGVIIGGTAAGILVLVVILVIIIVPVIRRRREKRQLALRQRMNIGPQQHPVTSRGGMATVNRVYPGHRPTNSEISGMLPLLDVNSQSYPHPNTRFSGAPSYKSGPMPQSPDGPTSAFVNARSDGEDYFNPYYWYSEGTNLNPLFDAPSDFPSFSPPRSLAPQPNDGPGFATPNQPPVALNSGRPIEEADPPVTPHSPPLPYNSPALGSLASHEAQPRQSPSRTPLSSVSSSPNVPKRPFPPEGHPPNSDFTLQHLPHLPHLVTGSPVHSASPLPLAAQDRSAPTPAQQPRLTIDDISQTLEKSSPYSNPAESDDSVSLYSQVSASTWASRKPSGDIISASSIFPPPPVPPLPDYLVMRHDDNTTSRESLRLAIRKLPLPPARAATSSSWSSDSSGSEIQPAELAESTLVDDNGRPIERVDTMVIGHLLKSRAKQRPADLSLSRGSSRVSHIERAGSIKAVSPEEAEEAFNSRFRARRGRADRGGERTNARGRHRKQAQALPLLVTLPEAPDSAASQSFPGGVQENSKPQPASLPQGFKSPVLYPLTKAFGLATSPSARTPATPTSQYPFLDQAAPFYAHTAPLNLGSQKSRHG